jgi:hypothetical protein
MTFEAVDPTKGKASDHSAGQPTPILHSKTELSAMRELRRIKKLQFFSGIVAMMLVRH